MKLIEKYFPELSLLQQKQFRLLFELYAQWNNKINLISRKDIVHLEERHILHSLAVSKIIKPVAPTSFVDVGTGGGFPGIPLAILFQNCNFLLIDSIAKKIKAVQSIAENIGLTNVCAEQLRIEKLKGKFDFILARAVTTMDIFYEWTKDLVMDQNRNTIPNGILYLKGGDVTNELKDIRAKADIYPIDNYFSETFYSTKKIIHIYNS